MKHKYGRFCLPAVAGVLAVTLMISEGTARKVKAEDYDIKYRAAVRMEQCMERIKERKKALGIPITKEDIFQTGMLGQEYTPMTTTIGALEAKRTTADPNMAALVVEMLKEAGVRPGDRVGAGFSGSFPSMDLAVLCACEEMGVDITYISSAGASSWGANQPELPFPDMALLLAEEGLLSHNSDAVSLGGDLDCGVNMADETREDLIRRFEEYPCIFIYEPDYEKDIAIRKEIYEKNGGITCFIGVGGNETTSGLEETQVGWGVTQPFKVQKTDSNSGLLDTYNSEGLPVIQLLNIKKIVTEYGLPYAPENLPAIGTGEVYFETQYPVAVAAAGVAAAAAILCIAVYREKKRE